MKSATPSILTSRRLPSALYGLAVLATCLWVLSLPAFPSQDGPLHLYYINVLRQLLAHRPGPYSDTYFIRSYLPPYSTYYYGLIALGWLFSLETADKVFACASIILFAGGILELTRAAGVRSAWAPLLATPFFLNWPLMMGFASYSLGISLACFALAAWCRMVGAPGLQRRGWFLLAVVVVVLTHPIPWLVVVGFAFFELSLRLILAPEAGESRRSDWLWDLVTALLACVPALYVAHFRGNKTQVLDYVDPVTGRLLPVQHPGPVMRFQAQLFELRHLLGLTLFDGEGLSRIYRMGLQIVLIAALLIACRYRVVQWRKGTSPVYMSTVWLLFSIASAGGLLLIPNDIGGGYFFATRLEIMLVVCLVVASGFALQHTQVLAVPLGLFAFLLNFFVIALGVRFITPVARQVASVQHIPASVQHNPQIGSASALGMVMRPPGSGYPPHLTFHPFYWAPASFFRAHNLLLFNTAWLGDPIIPVYPRPGSISALDGTFYNESPQFPSRLLLNQAVAADVLQRLDFVLSAGPAEPYHSSPFALQQGDRAPVAFASGWHCQHDAANVWNLCVPSRGR